MSLEFLRHLPVKPNCAQCPFSQNGTPRHKPVLAEKPVGKPLGVLIGEGPGREEVAQQRPFCGPAGNELDNALANVKLSRSRLLVINATGCQPPSGMKSEAKMKAAVRACGPLFRAQFAAYVDLPAFVMGKHAWEAIGPVRKGGVKKGRGFVRPRHGGQQPFIVSWHPTFAFFYDPYRLGEFLLDLDRFARLIAGKLRPGPARLVTSPTLTDLRKMALYSSVAVDIETAPASWDAPWTGKDPIAAKLRTIGFGSTEWGLSVRWDTAPVAVKAWSMKMVKTKRTIWQNGIWFDHRVLRRYGFEIGSFFDTREARRALSSTSLLNLGYMSCLYDDPGPWKEGTYSDVDDEEEDDKGIIFTNDYEALCRYNAEDCVRQARVEEGLTKEAEWNTPRVQALYQQHLQLAEIAAEMHTSGMGVDLVRRASLSRDLEQEYEKRCAELRRVVEVSDFKINAPSLRKLIFKRYETKEVNKFHLADPIDPAMWTEKGTIKVDQTALLSLITSPWCPPELAHIIRLYWQADAVRQARSTFVVSKYVEQAIGPDERIRPGWNSCGAATGRWACGKPNLMNLSKEKE